MSEIQSTLKKTADWIAPVNGLILLGVTVTDLTAPALDKWAARFLAVLIALCIFVIWHRFVATKRKVGGQDVRLIQIAVSFLRDTRNICTIVLLIGAVFFFVSNLSYAKDRGLLAHAAPALIQLQDRLFGLEAGVKSIKSDTEAIRKAVAPSDPVGQLRLKGYGIDDESKAKAIEACDIDALKLYSAIGQTLPLATPVFGSRAGSNLERPIMTKNPRLPDVLQILADQGADLNQRFPVTFTQNQTGQIPDFDSLAAYVRRQYPVAGSVFFQNSVHANALALAIWADNRQAATILVRIGVNANEGIDVQLPFVEGAGTQARVHLKLVKLSSAKQEAARLNRSQLLTE